jgi:hypothetical protein
LIMKAVYVLLSILISTSSWAACSWTGNTGTVASPYAVADVSACLTDAASKTGEVTVQIPNSSVTWSSGVTVDHSSGSTNVTSLTLRGQNDCTLDAGGVPTSCGTNIANFYVNYTGKEGKAFRLAHFTATGTSGIRIDGDGKSWRFDHIYWNTVTGYTSTRIIWIAKSVATGVTEGLIDHNYFKDWAWGTLAHYQPGADGGNYEWMTGAELGTSHAIYFENNKMHSSAGGYYLTDNNGPSRWVFRYNDIKNAYIAGHDAQVGGFRGALKLEAYSNTFTFDVSGNCYVMYRSGANGVFFNNTIAGANALDCNNPLFFANYRNDGAYGYPTACSNTSGKQWLSTTSNYPQTCTSGTGCINTDGSASSPNGYPCRDQVGASGNDPQVGGGAPFLFWNNTIGGSDASSHIAVGFGADHIVLNRDYCTAAVTMPATCNGVTTTYTAYTYPHPLISGAADTTAPTVETFTIPSTATTLTVTISAFTASDSGGVTGYCVNETASAPTAGTCGDQGTWSATAQTSYTFAWPPGAKTLYAWAKDAAGNISTSLNDAVTITLPPMGGVALGSGASIN